MQLISSLVTPHIKDDYNKKGFAIIENVFSESLLETCRNAFDELVIETDKENLERPADEHSISINGKYFIPHPEQRKPDLNQMLFNDTVADITTSLLGSEVFLYWSQTVIKLKNEQSQFAWHQDSGYAPVLNHHPYLTCWMALDDVNLDNGTVSMLGFEEEPKSREVLKHEWCEREQALIGYRGDKKGTPIIMKAGSVAVFTSHTLHCSSPNINGKPRRVYYVAYSPEVMYHEDGGGKRFGLNIPFIENGQRVDSFQNL